MERWSNKVAVVTGASSGIGSAITVALVNAGMIVIGFARRQERVDELKTQLSRTAKGTLHSFKCDVQNEEEVVAAFAWVVQKFGGIDVLINNAGISKPGRLTAKGQTRAIREVIATNIMGVVLCTREAYASMTSRGIDGHIILINSILGHSVPVMPGAQQSIYPPTKYAVTAMTEVLRQEFQADGNKIKVTVSEINNFMFQFLKLLKLFFFL